MPAAPAQSGSARSPAAALLFVTLVVLLVTLLVSGSRAAPATAEGLLDRKPFDEITLNQAAGGAVLEVAPLDLPDRKVPTTPPAGNLTVELVDRPGQAYAIAWSDVAQIRLYETRLLAEAKRLTAAGQFDEAYDYYARLLADYPKLDGLNEAVSDYLRRNSLALYQAKHYERAMAVLASLYERDPQSPGLAKAVDTVAGEIIDQHLRDKDYVAARAVLALWRRQFKQLDLSAADTWEQRFAAAADRQLDEAKALVEKQDYIAARHAAHQALTIWPELEAAHQLLTQVQEAYPSVTVGVFETAPRKPVRRLDCWAALRSDRLVERTLAEEVGFGSEGGIYRSPYGKLALDDSGLRLSLKLAGAAGLTSDALTRYLLSMADPGSPNYEAEFGGLLAAVDVDDDDQVNMELQRPHVRPEALLQVPPPPHEPGDSDDGDAGPPRFKLADVEQDSRVYAAVGESDNVAHAGLRVVVERTMPDDESAVAALIAGDVDVLDRVPPWQIERLRATPGVRVGRYRLPTVHVLVPNSKRKLLATREFRRALCYGLQREWIVQRVLLGGTNRPGFEVLSGPFPAGVSLSDPVRYAYNSLIKPRPFEPRLAAILASVGWSSTRNSANEGDVELGQIPELVLAHPADPIARLACQSIQLQLSGLGIKLKLVEYNDDDLLAGRVDYDLRYAELAMWEPVVDARRLLGTHGLAGAGASSYLLAALRHLDEATNWRDVRARLAEIHEIANHDLPVIPLWQTVNYFAYRSSVAGIGDTPVTLYQDVDHWDLSGASRQASAGGQ